MFLKHRAAPLIAGVGLLTAIATILLLVDAFSPAHVPAGFSSMRQLVGINLLLMLVPAYMVTAWGIAERRSRALLERVDATLENSDFAARVRAPWSRLLLGAGLGAAYAVLFNLPIRTVDDLIHGSRFLVVIVALMILVWVSVGVTLAARLHVSRLFLEAGRGVPVDLYDQSTLSPFARAGMGDLLLVVGALVLTLVQSIDVTFRTENYFYALAVGLPAGMVLLVLPMASVHRRLKVLRTRELEQLDALIGNASKTLDDAAMGRLERLLMRRERARQAYTWPLDVAMVSRIVLYGIIPPGAWIAAALVEHVVEAAIAP